jgi:hypothetical protein
MFPLITPRELYLALAAAILIEIIIHSARRTPIVQRKIKKVIQDRRIAQRSVLHGSLSEQLHAMRPTIDEEFLIYVGITPHQRLGASLNVTPRLLKQMIFSSAAQRKDAEKVLSGSERETRHRLARVSKRPGIPTSELVSYASQTFVIRSEAFLLFPQQDLDDAVGMRELLCRIVDLSGFEMQFARAWRGLLKGKDITQWTTCAANMASVVALLLECPMTQAETMVGGALSAANGCLREFSAHPHPPSLRIVVERARFTLADRLALELSIALPLDVSKPALGRRSRG